MSSSALSENLSGTSDRDKSDWQVTSNKVDTDILELNIDGHNVGSKDAVGEESLAMGHVAAEQAITDHNEKIADLGANEKNHIHQVPITKEAALGHSVKQEEDDTSKISAYARLDFDNFSFYVQTLQVVLGRKSNQDMASSSNHSVDVHLSVKKAISRRHAKIFYNFGTQRFELSILGRNGAFVDNMFVEKGITVPLIDRTKIQIGDIPFVFILPSVDQDNSVDRSSNFSKPFNPSDAINLRTNLYKSKSPTPKSERIESKPLEKEPKATTVDDIPSSEKIPSLDKESSLTINSKNDISSTSMSQQDDSGILESQIQNILADAEEVEDPNMITFNNMTEGEIAREEDEIDKLVKEHNMEQGVILEDDDVTNIDMDLSVLDQEIAALAPLIDSHGQSLMKEKEQKRKKLEEEKKRKQEIKKIKDQIGNSIHQQNYFSPSTDPKAVGVENNIYSDASRNISNFSMQQNKASGSGVHPQARTTPLMGKPATPRMGKPASIQPPISRLYGRQFNGLTKTQMVDNKLTTTTLTGIPTHLVGMNGMPLKLSSGIPMMKSTMPSRVPPPKLEVPINVITQKTTSSRNNPTITIGIDFLPKWDCSTKSHEISESNYPLPPKKRKEIKRQPKKVYTLDEIPEQFRTKPSLSYTFIVTNILKSKGGENGLTISEINESVKDIYPYYKYCPDGWQFSVSHNVKLNKIFKRVTKKDDEWTYILDESYIGEREKIRKKQQEIAAAKAKEAAIRAEELKQKQKLEAQQAISNNIVGRNFSSPYGTGIRIPQSQFISQLHQKSAPPSGQKQKSIAELASEIRRDGVVGSKAPLYFKPQSILQMNSSGELVKRHNIPASVSGTPSLPVNIKAQLAANRASSAVPSHSGSPPSNPNSQPQTAASSPGPSSPPPSNMHQDTKKSLAYLQKELFTLYKARNLSYNTATTTEIITKALATTIAQVNVIGAKAGCKDNALGFLVEKAPQQVSKILDIALSKSIKEKQGSLSNSSSRATTPAPPVNSSTESSLSTSAQSTSKESTQASSAVTRTAVPSESISVTPVPDNLVERKVSGSTPTHTTEKHANSSFSGSPKSEQAPSGASALPLPKPPSFNQGKSASPRTDTYPLSRPPTFTSSIPRPPGFTKSSGLSKPPQFLSNKSRPAGSPKELQNSELSSQSPNIGNKRNFDASTSHEEAPSKITKLE